MVGLSLKEISSSQPMDIQNDKLNKHKSAQLIVIKKENIYYIIHTYHSRFIPAGVAEVSQIFLRDTHVLPKLVSYEEYCRRDRW
jgi:hypothetical protein